MTVVPTSVASPPATRLQPPRWRDARLLVGLLLVLVSVVAGSRVVAGAERSDEVWAAARDLPAGTRLIEGDLELRQVRLEGLSPSYVAATDPDPVGGVLGVAVAAGDLLPRSALGAPAGATVEVTVPVEPQHVPPDLVRGSVVDVLLTRGSPTAGGSGEAEPVLRHLLVVSVDDQAGALSAGASSVGVVLQVTSAQAVQLVTAIRGGSIDLVLESS